MAAVQVRSQINIVPVLLYILLFVIAGYTITLSPHAAFLLMGIIFFVIFFFHTKQAVFVYSFYFAFEETILQYIPETFYLFAKYSGDEMLLALALAVFAKLATRRYEFTSLRNNPINVPIFIFLFTAVVSALVNHVPLFVAFTGIRQIFRFILLFYLIVAISTSEWDSRTVRLFISMLFVAVALQVVIGIIQKVLGPGSAFNHFLAPGRYFFVEGIPISGGRTWAQKKGMFGTVLNRNSYGIFMMSFSLLFLGRLSTSKAVSIMQKIFFASLLLCVFFSYSRQAIYGLFIGMFVIGLISKNRQLIVALMIAVSLFILYVKQFNVELPEMVEEATLAQRIASPFQKHFIQRSLTADRLYVLVNFTPKLIFSEYFVLGLGPAAIGSAVGAALGYFEGYKKIGIKGMEFRYVRYVSDLGFLALLGQFGILGLAALFWAFLRLFLIIFKAYKETGDDYFRGMTLGVLGLVPGLLATNVGYSNFDLRQSSFYFWLIIALTISYWGRETAVKLGWVEEEGFK